MKRIAIALLAILAVRAHADTTLPNPSMLAVIGHQCGAPAPVPVSAGFSADGNYVLSLMRGTTSCSTGGRGSRPATYSGYGLVRWDLAGHLIDVTHPTDFEFYPAPQGYDVYIANGRVVLVRP